MIYPTSCLYWGYYFITKFSLSSLQDCKSSWKLFVLHLWHKSLQSQSRWWEVPLPFTTQISSKPIPKVSFTGKTPNYKHNHLQIKAPSRIHSSSICTKASWSYHTSTVTWLWAIECEQIWSISIRDKNVVFYQRRKRNLILWRISESRIEWREVRWKDRLKQKGIKML